MEGTGTTMAVPAWLTRKNPQERLDNADNVHVQPVNISRQQIFNPKIMGNTASTTAWKVLHAGLTLEAGVRLKNHGGDSDSIFVGVDGVTQAGDAVAHGWELRPGEEVFLEVDNLNKVSRYGGSTISFIAT